MRDKETKSNLLLVAEDIFNAEQLTIHAQWITSYPVSGRQLEASEKLIAQAAHFKNTNHLVEDINDIPKSRREYKIRQ